MSAAVPAAPFRRPSRAGRPPSPGRPRQQRQQRQHGASGAAGGAVGLAAATAATAAAVMLGAATEAAQGALPTAWGPLANSVTAWVLLPAALTTAVLAALPPRGAAGGRPPVLPLVTALVTGLVTTQGLVAGYYGWAALVSGTPHAWSSVVLWSAAGLVSGTLVGVVALVRASETGALRGAATGLLAAVPLADGGRTVVLFPWQASAGWAFAALAVVVLLVGLRRGERAAGWMTAAAAVAAGAAGFALLDAAVRIASA